MYLEDELLGATLILAWVPKSRIQWQDEEALCYITPDSSLCAGHRRSVASAPRARTAPAGLTYHHHRDEDVLEEAQGAADTVDTSSSVEEAEGLARGPCTDSAFPAPKLAHPP